MLNVKIRDSTIGKGLKKDGLFVRVSRRRPLLFNKNVAAQLKFAKSSMNKPQDFWNTELWTDATKVEMFGYNEQHHATGQGSHAQREIFNRVAVWQGVGCGAAGGGGGHT